MTVRELIKALQDLGENNLDRKVVMDTGRYYITPNQVDIVTEHRNKLMQGTIVIE